MKTNIYFLSYLAQFFSEWEMFQTKVTEEIKTHILCAVTYENVEKYSRAGEATDDTMGNVHFTLDT